MPPRVPSAPPLSSRAVLLVGVLALVCLVFFAALLLVAAEPAEPALSLDGPPPAAAEGVTQPTSASPSEGPSPGFAFSDEPVPIPTGVLTALEQSAEEPLEVELTRLLDALQHGFGERSVQVEPTLRPYTFRLAGRLNVRAVSFRVRVSAPDPALAEARAATLRNLFEAAGVAPGRLTVVASRGAPVLLADPS